MTFKLLTPGPLTTTRAVREEMLADRCTWDDDYKALTQKIRAELLEIGDIDSEKYTSILMQGSGSFTVESVLTSTIRETDKVLLITNGAYGERMVSMAKALCLSHLVYAVEYDAYPELVEIERILAEDQEITHIAVVHCETTTGILNPIEEIGRLASTHGKTFIVDAMSSYGGVPIDVEGSHIDYLISSANKCIQGVPGFGFVIARKEKIMECEGVARSVSLDLYDQWKVMDVEGKWRFTSPTHVVAAFSKALDELIAEGGVAQRYTRYQRNNAILRAEMEALGFKAYISEDKQSPIITTFLFPNDGFSFEPFYEAMKAEGFVLYPGKLTEVDTFRVGNIGDVHEEDMIILGKVVKKYTERLLV